MAQYDSGLSNLSYTNKDFGSIFPEMLEIAKKLSYKWDPMESDESDPGVVLLKLAALMADKDSYNIDKNILELFPLSVTQLSNARQLYDQCGYTMRYYQAATASISMSVLSSPFSSLSDLVDIDYNKPVELTVPRYTSVTDMERKITYTTTEAVTLKCYLNDKNEVVKTEEISDIPIVQGGINHYTINNSTLLTLASLDYNNRLYFSEKDIAENAIYISNVGSTEEWHSVDNLYIQKLGEKCFKFGVDPKSDRCYVEFPSDIHSLIGGGITLSYIRTDGREGRVRKRVINGFLTNPTAAVAYYTQSDEKVTIGNGGTPITVELTSGETGNTYVTNREASNGGSDPETISDAYKNYQRVKNTFDTLVTLKDYTDYIVSNNFASNGFVCDRGNDIQSTYTVMEHIHGNNVYHTIVRDKYEETSGIYIKGTDGNMVEQTSSTYYSKSPEMNAFTLRVYPTIYVSDASTPINFINSFKMSSESSALQYNISKRLSDVKCIGHDFIGYEKDRILMIKNKYPLDARIIPYTRLSDEQQREVVSNVVKNLYEAINAKKMIFGNEAPYDEIYDVIISSDARIKALVLDDFDYQTYAVYLDSITNKIEEIRIDDDSSEYLITTDSTPVSGVIYYTKTGDTYSNATVTDSFADDTTYYTKVRMWREFRRDIFAKSVLAGVTPLFKRDKPFSVMPQHTESHIYNEVYRVTTSTSTTMEKVGSEYKCTLRPNENVVLSSPSLVTEQSYSNYCKYLLYLVSNKRISANSEYTLQDGEYVCFFYKPEGSEYYHYTKYTTGTIIVPSISVSKQAKPNRPTDMPEIPWDTLGALSVGSGGLVGISIGEGTGTYATLDAYVDALCEDRFVLSTTSIDIKKVHEITITDSTRQMCWILNTHTTSDNKQVCRLFDTDKSLPASYMLQPGEYLIYSNASHTQLHLLGSGTKITITRSDGDTSPLNSPMDCDIISYDNLISFGVDYLKDVWQTIPAPLNVVATEMGYTQLGAGADVVLSQTEGITLPSKIDMRGDGFYNNETNEKLSLSGVSISYSTGGSRVYLPVKNARDLEWEVRYLLNLVSAPTSPQVLKYGQSISFVVGKQGASAATTINGDDNDPYMIETNRTISVVGGTDVDVSTVDLSSGGALPLSLYAYKFSELEEDSETIKRWEVSSEMGLLQMSIINPSNHPNVSHTFSIPNGSYVFSTEVSSEDTTASFTMSLGDGNVSSNLVCLNDNGATQSAKGTYYYLIDVKEPTIELTLTASTASSKPLNCWIGEFVSICGDAPDVFDNGETFKSFIGNQMLPLDVDKVFNYAYIVDDSNTIKKPLDAKSFLISSHIYNPFTICEWNLVDTDATIKVVNKIRGGV